MNKPEGVECWHCRRWYWYGASCSAYSYSEEFDIDPMSPSSIKDCDKFEIKLHSEHGSEPYDQLPPPEIIELARAARNAEYDALIERIKNE